MRYCNPGTSTTKCKVPIKRIPYFLSFEIVLRKASRQKIDHTLQGKKQMGYFNVSYRKSLTNDPMAQKQRSLKFEKNEKKKKDD